MASMKELFPEFYLDSLEVTDLKRKQNNLIIFDSNFLLDILRLPTEIAEKYLEAIDKVKDHIFVPYLVGVEFHFNKKKVKIETQESLNNYRDRVTNNVNTQVEDMYNNMLNSLVDEKNIDFLKNKNQKDNALNEIKRGVDSYYNSLCTEKEKLITRLHKDIFERYSTNLDVLSNKIVELVGQSVASKLEQELINKIQDKGKERYDNKIPPGFNDKDNKAGILRRYSDLVYDTQYGDYIIWEEILHKVSEEGNSIGKKVIFVTSDGTSERKNDIMYSVKGKKVGPSIQMVIELYELCGNNSLSESSTDGEKLNKELYVIDGFRFMQLANDLNDDEAKQYEVDPFVNKKNISKNQVLDLRKDVNRSEDDRESLLNLLKDIFLLEIKLGALKENLKTANSEEEVDRLRFEIIKLRRELRRLNNKKTRLQEFDIRESSIRKSSTELEALMLAFEECKNNIHHVKLLIDEETDIENLEELNKILRNLKLSESTLSKEIARFSDDFYGDI